MNISNIRFSYITNEANLLDRIVDQCLRPIGFLCRSLFGKESLKVYKIDQHGSIQEETSPSQKTSAIHTFCMLVLGTIALVPGTLVGGALKGWSICTSQHKCDNKKLQNYLKKKAVQDASAKETASSPSSTTSVLPHPNLAKVLEGTPYQDISKIPLIVVPESDIIEPLDEQRPGAEYLEKAFASKTGPFADPDLPVVRVQFEPSKREVIVIKYCFYYSDRNNPSILKSVHLDYLVAVPDRDRVEDAFGQMLGGYRRKVKGNPVERANYKNIVRATGRDHTCCSLYSFSQTGIHQVYALHDDQIKYFHNLLNGKVVPADGFPDNIYLGRVDGKTNSIYFIRGYPMILGHKSDAILLEQVVETRIVYLEKELKPNKFPELLTVKPNDDLLDNYVRIIADCVQLKNKDWIDSL